MEDLALFAEESSLFASPYLAEALNCNLYVILPQYNNFFKGGRQGKFWDNGRAIQESNIIIIGYSALKAIAPKIKNREFKTIAFIISDSSVCREMDVWNPFVDKYGITVYAMPDMIPYCKVDYIPVYQTMKINHAVSPKPNNKLIVTHSPSNNEKAILKGTPQIIEFIKKLQKYYDFDFRLISNMPMDECIRVKSSSHIFIDQLIYRNPYVPQNRWGNKIKYNGGLGKSGIEAMLLKCCVITGGIKPKTEPYFPSPPIIWTNYKDFYLDLERLIASQELRDNLAIEQKQWTNHYLSAEFVSKHLTRHIRDIKIAVYTVIIGEFDDVKPIPSKYKDLADYYLFADQDIDAPEYIVKKVRNESGNNRRESRKYKIQPEKYLSGYDYFLYLDGSIELLTSPQILVNKYLKNHDITVFPHPWYNCIYKEFKVCVDTGRVSPEIAFEQEVLYRSEGYLEENGLTENGVILRRNCQRVYEFDKFWNEIYDQYTDRDQLSFCYCAWKKGLKYNTFEGQTSNPARPMTKEFKLHEHGR